jgi:two-component system, OmpR family, sensor histidine kinase TctE
VVSGLAEVLAGFPLAASFAIAGGIGLFREGRRRSALNEAIHELRRPLQVLALSLPSDTENAPALNSSLHMATAAVDRLDREINGGGAPAASAPIALRSVVEEALERWRGRAAIARRPLSLAWKARDPLLRGDGVELGQALDNLISNAFEHGGGEVRIEALEDRDLLRIVVLDEGRVGHSQRRGGIGIGARLRGRGRHGHGLRVVRRVAAQHGGSFRLRRSSRGVEARLELPLEGDR